ncbi:hypothetical protein IT072_02955 [Leifsonia sp. ZF2019]|nr:hypothetical protein [Leifsonia sp. ZF2019]UAJ80049.1 hypothetical protein IT072_02955 [Leifsonia sp. ZF2019]
MGGTLAATGFNAFGALFLGIAAILGGLMLMRPYLIRRAQRIDASSSIH